MMKTRNNRIFITTVIFILIFYLSINSLTTYDQSSMPMENNSNSQVRIHCLILTSKQYLDTRARAVHDTWASRCDKYHFISEYVNDTRGLQIAPIANITPGYDHLTQKTTLALHFAYENSVNDTDWFVKTDDDTYLFVENLKKFLKVQDTSLPITFGYNFKIKVPLGFHAGGAAYVLSREALKRFYEAHHEPNTTCLKDGGAEDIEIANCLRKKGVYPGKSVDEHNRERFHHLTFSRHFRGEFPDWLIELAENRPVAGPDCCSNSTISFHYVTPQEQYLIDKVRYGFHKA